MPIRLHLDTSDYSAMYAAATGTPEADVRDYLQKLVDQGDLEVGVSYHVIVELLPRPTEKFRADRLARARFLKRLCRYNALAYDGEFGKGCQFSTDGRWLPQSIFDDLEVERLVTEVMRLTLPHRNRRGSREVFTDLVRNNPLLVDFASIDGWPLKIAFCFLAEGELSRYVLGKITREEVNRNLRRRISDPVLFYKNWIEPHGMEGFPDKRGRLIDMMRKSIDSLQSMLDEQASISAEASRLLKTSGDYELSREERGDIIRLTSDLKNFKQEIMSATDLCTRVPVWAELYGEKSALVAAEVMFALHREKNRLRKASDAIDFAHALFLPHVDLWRGDRAFSDLLKKHRVTGCERVVPKLAHLPARIDAELSRRAG